MIASSCPADAIALIDPLFSVRSPAPDQVSACYFTEHNVNHTRDIYRNRGGLKALQRIIASLAPTFEPWIASLNLQTPEAIKIVRKSLELGSFWASVCFWKEPEWSEQEYVRRLRCPALWTAASWVMDMLNDELGVPTEAVIQIHQDGWDGIFVFDSLPDGVAHVNECLRAMRHGVWTVRQWIDEYWWAQPHYPQLEAAVKGYLDTQYQRTAFDTLDEFLEYRCKSAGGAPIHLLMAILKRDVEHASKDTTADITSANEEASSSGVRSDHQSSTDDDSRVVSNKHNDGASSDDDAEVLLLPEQFGSCSLSTSGRRCTNNKPKKIQGRAKVNQNKVACSTIPMGLLDLSTVQTTAINDILDHERDAAEGSPNLVNFMHSQLLLDGNRNNNTEASSVDSSSAEALALAISFHRRITHDLHQDVERNPAGLLEKQAAQVAYGCYLMEVLHPRYSELAGQIAALYPPLTNANDHTQPTEERTQPPNDELSQQSESLSCAGRDHSSSQAEVYGKLVLLFKLFVLFLLVTVCN